jgi:hypothetical protein
MCRCLKSRKQWWVHAFFLEDLRKNDAESFMAFFLRVKSEGMRVEKNRVVAMGTRRTTDIEHAYVIGVSRFTVTQNQIPFHQNSRVKRI